MATPITHTTTTTTSTILALLALLATIAAARGRHGAQEAGGDATAELTLERLFPEKGLFGPAASSMSFAHDGRWGAYLYRPYLERRHGSDLWVYDTETGATRRVTMVSVMSEFQESTRKVRDDRIQKAKKRRQERGRDGSEAKAEAGTEAGTEAGDGRPAPDDGVSGSWKGKLTGGEAIGLSKDGLPVTLVLRRADDGTIGGEMTSFLSRVTIADGRHDTERGTLACTLRGSSGLAGRLEADLSDGVLLGTLRLARGGHELTLTAELASRAGETGAAGTAGTGETTDEDDAGNLGDVVDDKDADDEKAPRYAGIGSYTWARDAHELIFTSQGDLYRYALGEGSIGRLTRTADAERDVQYLPDGSGYSYLRGNALIRVRFGGHLIEELNPPLERGERMSGYRLSPDGTRLVVLASKGESMWTRGRKVNIVSYRERFAQVRQVNRHMPDDPLPEQESSVYLYDLGESFHENGHLKKVYTRKQSGPRDVMRVPEWAPDSSRVAFAVFAQASGHVEILEARFLPEPEAGAGDAEKPAAEESAGRAEGGGDEGREGAGSEAGRTPGDESKEVPIEEARVAYRFLHNGGPNTPSMVRPQYLADSRRLAFITELSGFRHLHVLNPLYEQLDQLTHGRFEVYPLDISRDHERLFCTATRDDPAQQHVFTVDLTSGEMKRLTTDPGVYSSAAVSDDGARVLASFVDFGRPRELVAVDVGAESGLRVLTDSHPEEAKALSGAVPEYFTYSNRHGQEIHGHMFKPEGWSAGDRRPLLIYVYGGPLGTRKMVTRGAFSAASYFFAWYMAQTHGWVACTIDPRGASGYGGLFEKSNFEQVGRPQVEDLVDGAKWFAEDQGVDPDRIALHGWSFGGFQTQMCLYTEPDVFACGIAGAGPTEWENYNSWYSTGTIGENRAGKTDLEKFSLLPLAKNLKARLLLVHGMEDSNVLYQDTVRVYRELLKAGKETLVELFLDPTGGHGLGGDVKSLNRYRKYEEFLLRCLGEGAAGPADESAEGDGEP